MLSMRASTRPTRHADDHVGDGPHHREAERVIEVEVVADQRPRRPLGDAEVAQDFRVVAQAHPDVRQRLPRVVEVGVGEGQGDAVEEGEEDQHHHAHHGRGRCRRRPSRCSTSASPPCGQAAHADEEQQRRAPARPVRRSARLGARAQLGHARGTPRPRSPSPCGGDEPERPAVLIRVPVCRAAGPARRRAAARPAPPGPARPWSRSWPATAPASRAPRRPARPASRRRSRPGPPRAPPPTAMTSCAAAAARRRRRPAHSASGSQQPQQQRARAGLQRGLERRRGQLHRAHHRAVHLHRRAQQTPTVGQRLGLHLQLARGALLAVGLHRGAQPLAAVVEGLLLARQPARGRLLPRDPRGRWRPRA